MMTATRPPNLQERDARVMQRQAQTDRVEWSVIVCTYNGADRLPATLSALALLHPKPREIVLIDNASTDASAALALDLAQQLSLPLRVVTEPRPGLAWARLAGMRAAQADWLCFVDDDNELASDYLDVATAQVLAHPELGMLGGRSCLPSGRLTPTWWTAHAASFAVGQPHAQVGTLATGMTLWGAGLCLCRAAAVQLLNANWIPQLTGRLGAQALSGDDSELCLAVQLLGWKIAYHDGLRLTHAIDPRRMQANILMRMHAAWGATQPVLRVYDQQLHGQRSAAVIYGYLGLRCLGWSLKALVLRMRLWLSAAETLDESRTFALLCRFHRYRSAALSCILGLRRVIEAQRQAAALTRRGRA